MVCERRSAHIGLASVGPSCTKVACQRTALAGLTSKRRAASRREAPASIAAPTRSRRSTDRADAVGSPPRIAQHRSTPPSALKPTMTQAGGFAPKLKGGLCAPVHQPLTSYSSHAAATLGVSARADGARRRGSRGRDTSEPSHGSASGFGQPPNPRAYSLTEKGRDSAVSARPGPPLLFFHIREGHNPGGRSMSGGQASSSQPEAAKHG